MLNYLSINLQEKEKKNIIFKIITIILLLKFQLNLQFKPKFSNFKEKKTFLLKFYFKKNFLKEKNYNNYFHFS